MFMVAHKEQKSLVEVFLGRERADLCPARKPQKHLNGKFLN